MYENGRRKIQDKLIDDLECPDSITFNFPELEEKQGENYTSKEV